MKIIIHDVNIPKIMKREVNFRITEDAVIEFGKGVENYIADVTLTFDAENFTIQNIFMNKTESIRISYAGKLLVIDKEDFKHIEII